MTAFEVRLDVSGQTFQVRSDQTILEAAEDAGIAMPHSCLSGTCRACITKVLAGCLEHDPEYADEINIDQYEIDDGFQLLCSALACSDVELER